MSGGGSGGGASSSSSSASLAKQKIDSIRITGSEVKSSPDSHIVRGRGAPSFPIGSMGG